MKSLRSTLVLALIVALVGGYIYFNERGPAAGEGQVVLLRARPEAVDSLRLEHGGATLTLTRRGENWRVARGGAARANAAADAVPADSAAVRNLLDQIRLVQSPRVLPGGAARLREYGLDTPRAALRVGDDKIEFGARSPVDARRVYARVNDTVALLPAALGEAAAKPWDEWRDKAALRVSVRAATRLEITAPALAATLVKVSGSEAQNDSAGGASHGASSEAWKIIAPVAARADSEVVASFLSQLSSTQALAWLEDGPNARPARWGLDTPRAGVSVTQAPGEAQGEAPGESDGTATLLVGKKLKGGYAARNSASPSVFLLPETAFALINRPLRAWRSKAVARYDLNALSAVEIAARGGRRRFVKSGEDWKPEGDSSSAQRGGDAEQADTTRFAVIDVLAAARDLTARDFIDKPAPPAAYGLDKPALQLVITAPDDAQTVQLGLKDRRVYARSGQSGRLDPTVFALAPETFDRFKPALDALFPLAGKK